MQPVPMSPPCRWILDLVVCRCMVTVCWEEEVEEPMEKLNLMSCCCPALSVWRTGRLGCRTCSPSITMSNPLVMVAKAGRTADMKRLDITRSITLLPWSFTVLETSGVESVALAWMLVTSFLLSMV